MIKLIATDLDGTLINNNRTVPDDFEEVWNILNEKGIVLLAALILRQKLPCIISMKLLLHSFFSLIAAAGDKLLQKYFLLSC